MCLLDLIQRQAASEPGAIAVRTKSEQLTYHELNEHANAFASSLLQAGVQPGMLAGVFMDRSPEFLAALLGIWKIGAAYLALDPLSPPERLAFVIQDAGVGLVVAERKLAALLPDPLPRMLYADDLLYQQGSSRLPIEVSTSPADLAYILYTSGSTGRPKGVEVCHYSLANVITAVAEELRLQAGEVLLAHTSPGFDVSNLEFYLPLISGGTVYIAEAGRVGDGARLIRLLQDSGAATMLGTCTLWRLLLDAGWEGNPNFRAISGGEVLSLELAMALVARTAEVWNHYGPTEATICATTARIDAATKKVTIGRPISNVTVHVLDSNLQQVTEGTPGELYIGGLGVARAYRNRPDLSAASFLPDPFSSSVGARLYKTGDLARKMADGCLEFLGRMDQQVKIHGYRIELEEIEEQMRHFPGIGVVAVAALDRESGDQRLVAWYESSEIIPSTLLREFLRKRLPAYMLPSEFRRIASIPLNESGKIDRKTLNLKLGEFQVIDTQIEAETGTQSQLRSIWEDLLQIKPIALTDSFFDLGGNSLLAALLVAQIKAHFGEHITPDTLVEHPTIQSLAIRITVKENRVGQGLAPLRAKGSNPPFFIVHGLGGSALLFRSLAAHLSDDQPVYGVTLPNGGVRDLSDIEAPGLAAKCLEEIRSVCPSGPYYIGGHSFGALIAYEMALQLTQRGESIALLALIDGDRNIAKEANAVHDYLVTPGLVLRRYRAKLKSLTEKGIAEIFRRRVEYMKLRKRMKLVQKGADDKLVTGIFEAKELMAFAARAYNPAPYAGNVVLFRAADEVRSNKSGRDLGWGALAGEGLEIVDIPGGHMTIFDEPNVHVLAAALTERLSPVLSKA